MIKSEQQHAPRRSGPPRSLASVARHLTRHGLARHGFMATEIVSRWPDIVGQALAQHCLPESLVFPRGQRRDGTLHILAEGGFALELQHQTQLVLERVNRYFGYSAVSRIRLRQGVLPPAAPNKRRWHSGPLTVEQQKELSDHVRHTHDETLRERLSRLGTAVYNNEKNRGRNGDGK